MYARERTYGRKAGPLIGFMSIARSVAFVCALVSASPAIGQLYPSKPIRMVAPFAPGGISDILARIVAEQMAKTMVQPVVVDNRAGASGNIGTEMVAKAAGDGYTLLFSAPAFAMFSPVILVLPHVASGKLTALAVTSARRSRAFPEVPTIAEAAIPGFDVTSWFGVVAPASVPRARVSVLHASISSALRTPEIAERLTAQGAEPVSLSSEEFGS